MSKKKPNCDRNLTLDYEKELVADIEELQPKIIAAINDKNSHLALNKRVAMLTGRDLDVKYVGYTLDKDTGKKFPTYKVSMLRKAKEEAAPQPAAEEKKKFPVGRFHVTAFLPNKDTGVLERVVDTIFVDSDEDLSNRPADADSVVEEARKDAVAKGWHLDDLGAITEARKNVRGVIGQIAIDLEYDPEPPCRHCVATKLRMLESSLRNIEDFVAWRRRCLQERPNNEKFPVIFPQPEDWDKYEWRDDQLRLKKPGPSIREIKISKDQKDEIVKIISKAIGEDLSGDTLLKVAAQKK